MGTLGMNMEWHLMYWAVLPSWNTYYYLKEALKTQRPEHRFRSYMPLYDADYRRVAGS